MKNTKQSLLGWKIIMLFLYNPRICSMKEFSIIPTSPYFGEHNLIFNQILKCNSSNEYKVQFNHYIFRTANSTEIKGNITFLIPFDDTLFFEMNVATKDSYGRWKDKTFIQKAPNACSVFKLGFGNVWDKYTKSFGINNAICPIPSGVYTGDGMDTSILKETRFPQRSIYGSYKLSVTYSCKNEIFGCNIYFYELRRP